MAGARVLIVERNAGIRALMNGHLTAHGYRAMAVGDGPEAARVMRRERPDLLLIDQEVPLGGMKTARILRLHPAYRQIPVVLTVSREKMTRELLEQGKRIALDSFVAKPCTAFTLARKIEEGLRMNPGAISVSEVQQEIGRLTDMPVLLSNHRKMLALLAKEDDQVEVPQLIRTIERDQGLIMEILRICHSAYYGFRGNSIESAVTFLGIAKIRKIVQASMIFDLFRTQHDDTDEDGFSVLELWKHSVGCGLIMEAGGHRVKGRDHFIAGMLHDIGKVILHLRFPAYFAEIRRMVREEGKSMYRAEQELMGFSHADVGHELARKWDLPPTIAACIGFHHRPSAALQHRRLASLVHLSDVLTRCLEIGHGGDRRKIRLDPVAESLAKYVFAIAGEKDALSAEAESVVAESRARS